MGTDRTIHATAKEWYHSFDLFHHIGFLVATGTSVKSLLDIAMSTDHPIKKSDFKLRVLDMIREKMAFKVGDNDFGEDIDYAELNYEDHSEFIQYVLLLFNIETIRQKETRMSVSHFIDIKRRNMVIGTYPCSKFRESENKPRMGGMA